MKHWYAVYTHSRHEKKVAGLFGTKGLEHYLPLHKVRKQWSDRKKTVEEPLFRSYVFVRVDEMEKETVRRTTGVLNFVYWLGQPAVIQDNEIEVIRRFTGEYENLVVQNISVELHSQIKIDSGPLMNQVGKVVKVSKNKVKVLIESLGCYLIAELPTDKIVHL